MRLTLHRFDGLLVGLLFVAAVATAQLQRPQQQVQQSVTLQAPLDQVAVDALTALYLRLENALWQVIRSSGTNVADKLRTIHETHLTFFETGFGEKGVELSRMDTDQRNLHDAIGHINLTATVVRDAYLHANARDRKRDEAVRFAQHGVNMSQYMDKLFNVTEGTDFYHYIARKGQSQSCELGAETIQSAHHLIYSYYNDIAGAELKAYAIAQLSHMFNTVYEVRNSVTAAENLRRIFQQRGARAQERVRSLLAVASREVWVCDPDDPLQSGAGASAQVTRLLQGYVDNEVNLNEINDCKKTCPDYQSSHNYQCFNGSHCAANADVMEPAKLRCGGEVVGCEFISADMEICHSNDPQRRYDGIKYTCGKKMGSNVDACKAKKTLATSWTRWLVHCSHCFCYCDETGPHSDRYFSLQPVLSDITKNLVVTGVAIRKINRIFYWQITERPLIASAEVNTSAAAMVGIPRNGDFALRSTFHLTDSYVTAGIDYHTLSHAHRSINLDVLQVPAGHVCTGVRFAVELGSLKPEIRATAFDFKTGQLSRASGDSVWVRDTIFEKTPIEVEGTKVPTHALSKSVPDLRRNKYVEFGASDKWSDVAQSTVPFLDTQLVRPQAEAPLTGLGLYYKGVPDFGGYVAPKVLTFDYTTHVRTM